MHSRLVHSGVRSSLTIEMVSSALLTANKGECIITKRQFYNCLYYIPTSYADGAGAQVPSEQRFKGRGGRGKRIHINPKKDYFCHSDEASTLLKRVNSALEEIEEADEDKDTEEVDTETGEANTAPQTNNDSELVDGTSSNTPNEETVTDVRDPVKDYNKEGVGNKEARSKCLKQIGAIACHHAGDHSKCFQPQYCSFIRAKNEHPDWSNEELAVEAAKTSKRHGGKHMSIGKSATKLIDKTIANVFNEKSIDRIAECGTSNASEGFFGSLTQYSEGKRLNLDQGDRWKAMLHLSAANAGKGNKVKTHKETSALLGIELNEVEINQMKRTTKKGEQDCLRLNGENAKNQRTRTSLMKSHMMGKESSKKTRHKSGKVPTSESAKTKKAAKSVEDSAKGIRKCGNCRKPGHTAATCPMPKVKKRKTDHLINWDFSIKVPPPKKLKPEQIIQW